MSDISPGERAAALERFLQQGERSAARFADRALHGFYGCQEAGDSTQLSRFERQIRDRQACQDALKVRGRLEPDRAVRFDVRDALGSGGQHGLRAADAGLRLESGQSRRAERRQCEAADDFDDPVELERPDRAFVHAGSSGKGRGRSAAGNGLAANHRGWLMRLAIAAAPKPLSMLTTATPDAQLFSIPSSAASPPKLAP